MERSSGIAPGNTGAASFIVCAVILNGLHQEMPHQMRWRNIHLLRKLFDCLVFNGCQPNTEAYSINLMLWIM
jgi:hypothetical protein